jgi:TfoX/Sxy family transcriptional regulator of competence genes
MPYDEELGGRLTGLTSSTEGVTEKRMFGGLALMHHGRMFCGVIGSDLMVRVGPERFAEALDDPHARPMDFTGRPMRGYVYVEPAGTRTDAMLYRWIDLALAFVATLPPK